MAKKKISITYAANEAEAYYIETLIQTAAAKIIQENGARQMKIEIENLLTENARFEFDVGRVGKI